jgi:23S rRNA (cytidine1920-2'-O)/16S rRNA (cytidine1409-2'-O)-methyltransferase
MSTTKMRLDLLLEKEGFFSSRQSARTAVMEGFVLVNGIKITKPGTLIKDGARIELTKEALPQKYVSRGGLKLEKALREFGIDVNDRVCLDVGASTGGFSDCLLQSRARFVYAVDVGYGQIAWSLRTDARVKVIERTNARFLDPGILQGNDGCYAVPSLAVVDLSFISLLKVLPAIKNCLADGSSLIVALVKPQFEAGPDRVGRGGVVRSADVHAEVLSGTVRGALETGLYARDLTFSPIKGPKGNIEFFLLFAMSEPLRVDAEKIEATVRLAADSF